MLVLSRKIGERLVIGENITVVVSRVAGNRVTLGIEAPNDVRIVRGELSFEVDQAAPSARTVPAFSPVADAATASLPLLAK
jgi:carbon storage regulator